MKRIILFIILMLNTALVAQDKTQETLAKFIISDASLNGYDTTETYLKAGGYLVLYTLSDGNLYMANVMSKKETQSFGRLYSLEHEKIKETEENYEADVFNYKWRYINSYDTNKGTASVQLIKIYKPQGVTFKIKIIPENLNVLIYKGYMEGTLNLNKYLD